MTKTQVKRRLAKIIEMLNEAQSQLDELAYDMEETIDSIEPYENKDELTEQQEERLVWFEENKDTVSDTANDLTDLISNLEFID